MTERTANEIEGLILKAARGGGMPLGAAEDLAAAAPYLDLDAVASCPCQGQPPLAVAGPVALDLVLAGEGPQEVTGDGAVMRALVACYEARFGQRLQWQPTATGAVFEAFEGHAAPAPRQGRRDVPEALLAHLMDMAAKTMVPETEASRAAGAGAGLTDND